MKLAAQKLFQADKDWTEENPIKNFTSRPDADFLFSSDCDQTYLIGEFAYYIDWIVWYKPGYRF